MDSVLPPPIRLTAPNVAATLTAYGEPAVLRGHTIYFTSWKYVRQGSFIYQQDGRTLGMWDDDGPTPAVHVPVLMPRGVRLQAQQAAKIPNGLMFPAGIVREGGRYRAWTMIDGATSPYIRRGHNLYVGYFESDDAIDWMPRPVGEDGSNIVFRGDRDGSTRGCQTPSIFVDSSPTPHPYKMVYGGYVTEQELEAFAAAYPGEADAMAIRPDLGHWVGLCGAVSADGIRWETLREPLGIHHADTQNTCYYDLDRERYVAYVRAWDVTPRQPGTAGELFSSAAAARLRA
jgi:hypothetical protein